MQGTWNWSSCNDNQTHIPCLIKLSSPLKAPLAHAATLPSPTFISVTGVFLISETRKA